MMVKLPNNYFPHDFNARADRKILRLRKVLGIEGYGIFWMLVETLCLQENFSYPLKDADLLADDFGCSVEKVEAVIKQFGLFQIDKDANFFSLSLIARLQKYIDMSESGRLAATVRWEKARKLKELQQNDATALRPQSDPSTIIEEDIIEEDIIEEEKGKENRDSPTIWRSIFPNKTPGIVEITFVEGLREKFGSVKASQILFNLRELNFNSIRTMREALNNDGTIKPKVNNGTYNGQIKRSNNLVTAAEVKQGLKNLFEGRTET